MRPAVGPRSGDADHVRTPEHGPCPVSLPVPPTWRTMVSAAWATQRCPR
jgi:hypothetical protein